MSVKQKLDTAAGVVGKNSRETIEQLGAISVFFWKIISEIPSLRKNYHIAIEQMMLIGISSLPIVFVTSLFTGAVVSAQAAYQFSDYVPLAYLGFAVEKAITVEMGPVLTALVIAGRIGAAMAAELGTMRVTEQIDAMECLALDPFRFLLAPRMLACLIMLPVLTIYADFFCLLGGLGVAVFFVKLDHDIFFNGIKLFYADMDIYLGIIKGFVFGGAIALMGCYYGFLTSGGAEGVGISTRRSVVAASVMILVLDYVVVAIFI
jgi:phospholipid/cholesterol/gamma-HCH transport system permease protein